MRRIPQTYTLTWWAEQRVQFERDMTVPSMQHREREALVSRFAIQPQTSKQAPRTNLESGEL